MWLAIFMATESEQVLRRWQVSQRRSQLFSSGAAEFSFAKKSHPIIDHGINQIVASSIRFL